MTTTAFCAACGSEIEIPDCECGFTPDTPSPEALEEELRDQVERDAYEAWREEHRDDGRRS